MSVSDSLLWGPERDKKIIQLTQLAKLFLDDPESSELQQSIKEQRPLPDTTLSELTQEIASMKLKLPHKKKQKKLNTSHYNIEMEKL